jgi:hypothetical protein
MRELENEAVGCEIVLDCDRGYLRAEEGGRDVADEMQTERATGDLGWLCRAGEIVGAARRAVRAFVVVFVRARAGGELARRFRSGVLPARFAA